MPIPVSDNDLRGAVVLECSLGQLQGIIEEMQTFWAAASTHMLGILKAFGDLYVELTDETEKRKWLDKRLKAIERDAARLRLPSWFWRPEPDRSLPDMLKWRAIFLLHRRRILVDDVWDLLCEFATDYAGTEIANDDLAAIIQAATEAEAK